MRCPYCGAEVIAGMEHCAQCEIPIEWEGDEARFLAPGDDVVVYTARDPASLPVIESLLASNDIPFVVANDVTQDFFTWGRLGTGYNVLVGPPLVKVPADRAAEALELIASAGVGASDEEPAPPSE